MSDPIVIHELAEVSSCAVADRLGYIEFIGEHDVNHIINRQLTVQIRLTLLEILQQTLIYIVIPEAYTNSCPSSK